MLTQTFEEEVTVNWLKKLVNFEVKKKKKKSQKE